MRTKSLDITYSLPYWTRRIDNPGGTSLNQGVLSGVFRGTRSAAVVPGYRRKIQNVESATGQLVIDAYSDFTYSRGDGYSFSNPDTGSSLTVEGGGPFAGAIPGLPPFPAGNLDNAINRAKEGWIRKLVAQQQGAAAMVTLGEASESANMLRSRAADLSSAMTSYFSSTLALRKRHGIGPGLSPARRKVKDYLQEQNNLYLEYTYGWAPLVGEIDTWSKEIESNPFRGYRDVQSLMSRFSEVVQASDRPVYVGNSYAPLHWHRQGTLTYSAKYYGAYLLGCAVEQRLRGVGLMPGQFIPSLYELIPWSFVADYFSNLGTVVNSLSVASGTLAWSQTTTVVKKSMICSAPEYMPTASYPTLHSYIVATMGPKIAGTYKSYAYGTVTLSQTMLTRNPGTPSDMTPDLEIRMPSAHQAFNVFSLLAGRYRAFQRLL